MTTLRRCSLCGQNHWEADCLLPAKAPVVGRKDDSDKLRYDLIPAVPLEELVHCYTVGAKKYDDRNWEAGISFGRIFAAMMRHAWAWWRGSTRHEDRMHHLASVAWCAFALMEFERTHPEFDNRPKGQDNA